MEKNNYLLYILIILASFIKIPLVFFQELPPYIFCDEDIYRVEGSGPVLTLYKKRDK